MAATVSGRCGTWLASAFAVALCSPLDGTPAKRTEETSLLGPVVKGSATLDPRAGRLEADVCLTRPPSDGPFAFVLNKGLNIGHLTDASGKSLVYEGEHELLGGAMVGEGLRYRIGVLGNETAPDTVCIRYVGGFPVYTREQEKILDFKGLIAFTAGTVRAPEQAKWLPVVYDDAGTLIYATTYDLMIRCERCETIYLNGSGARPGPEARFQTDRPVFPVLFAGDLPTQRVAGLTLIGATVSAEAAAIFRDEVDAIAARYEGITGLPMTERPIFVGFDLVQPSSRLAFASWPTIAFGGITSFDEQVDTALAVPALGADLVKTLSHEMAHYYFGGLLGPGPLRGFVGEAVPEWLALDYVRSRFGAEVAASYFAQARRAVGRLQTLVPLPEVRGLADMNEDYRYRYGALLLAELHERLGDARFHAFVRALAQPDRSAPWSYEILEKVALESGVSEADWMRFERECIRPGLRAPFLADAASKQEGGT